MRNETDPVLPLYVPRRRAETRRARRMLNEALGPGVEVQARPAPHAGYALKAGVFVCLKHDTELYPTGQTTSAGSEVLGCPVPDCPITVYVRRT